MNILTFNKHSLIENIILLFYENLIKKKESPLINVSSFYYLKRMFAFNSCLKWAN